MGDNRDYESCRLKLESLLTPETRLQYFKIIDDWLQCAGNMTKPQFVSLMCKVLTTPEMVGAHNRTWLALLYRNLMVDEDTEATNRMAARRAAFTKIDPTEYIGAESLLVPPSYEHLSAATDLFLPDVKFISSKVSVYAWQHHTEVDDELVQYLLQACQIFVKNIITGMISRKKGYKIKDGRFQYAIGAPIPDPYLHNSSNFMDHTEDARVRVRSSDGELQPAHRVSLETAEQQLAHSLACATKRPRLDDQLTVQLLYDTLRDNPYIINMHSIHSLNLLKISLQLESDVAR